MDSSVAAAALDYANEPSIGGGAEVMGQWPRDARNLAAGRLRPHLRLLYCHRDHDA